MPPRPRASFVAYGGIGEDIIYGGSAGDFLAGGEGDDLIFGYGGNDFIFGDSGINADPQPANRADCRYKQRRQGHHLRRHR